VTLHEEVCQSFVKTRQENAWNKLSHGCTINQLIQEQAGQALGRYGHYKLHYLTSLSAHSRTGWTTTGKIWTLQAALLNKSINSFKNRLDNHWEDMDITSCIT